MLQSLAHIKITNRLDQQGKCLKRRTLSMLQSAVPGKKGTECAVLACQVSERDEA